MEQQAAATREIAGNVNAAASGVGHVTRAIGEIEAIAGRTASSATQLRRSAVEVAKQTDRIRHRVRAFTDEVRSMQV